MPSRFGRLAGIALAAAVALPLPAAAWTLREIAVLPGLADLVVMDNGALIAAKVRGELRVVSPLPAGAMPRPTPPRAGPPDRATDGSGEIRRAELLDPTDRYPHRVLGRFKETTTLKAAFRDGAVLRLAMPANSVFEDVRPRIIRIGGSDYIVTVRSYLDRGSALVALARGPDGLAIAAQGPAIGTPNRWLNPIGVGDFLGTGRPQIAVILTPHIAGTLAILEFQPGTLIERFRRPGYSNHALGSEVLGLHAIADLDGDGTDDFILPDRPRTSLVLLSVKGGEAKELARLALPAPIVASIVPAGGQSWLIGLADGRVLRLQR